ncbi:tyrosine-type recombinase/integrase [Aestuariibaculum marinum]|uniref:Site-specific integrase n=1 Tax=Aestuariibaculum marinum TaxID=2683592 RepID=A0A8J6PXT2_9FLAO|nr:tyrosine-type recombinase/integrase [Aestuariibaculum marinum]MBD0825515.1 site-specific integrase [Aestuariibaculum marinum]
MHLINELLTFGSKTEHDLEHDLEHKTPFSIPKIYDADGDLTKRWYVYFSYLDPKTGKMKRQKNIYGQVNRHKTKEARYALLALYKKRLLKLLKEGYNPFVDNTEHYKSQQQKDQKVKQVNAPTKPTENKVVLKEEEPKEVQKSSMSLKDALDYALKLKKNLVSERTLVDYTNRCKLFETWMNEHHADVKGIDQVSKMMVVAFLNDVQLNTSPRNRNNYRTCLSTIFQTLEGNEIINKNFVKNIPKLQSNPERHKTFTQKQENDIFEHLEDKDPVLLLFIKFIAYVFLRPKEVCRLKVGDIDFDENILKIKVKTKTLKTKIVPEILLKELEEVLEGLDKDSYLFTPKALGGEWEASLEARRDYFSKRFKAVVKDHFGFNQDYGLYSFRHTYITKVYRALVKESSPFAAKSKLMQITGHTTMGALEKYLRDIDAELPEDYSQLLNTKA